MLLDIGVVMVCCFEPPELLLALLNPMYGPPCLNSSLFPGDIQLNLKSLQAYLVWFIVAMTGHVPVVSSCHFGTSALETQVVRALRLL
jgi:hypothetical protein